MSKISQNEINQQKERNSSEKKEEVSNLPL